LQLEDLKMPMVFMVMNDIKAKYFIIFNNYLNAYKVNMIDDSVRYFTEGDRKQRNFYVRRLKIIPQLGKQLASPRGG
ncbi:hypothetical protein VP01_5548g1, partial [Puccinia sorghi]